LIISVQSELSVVKQLSFSLTYPFNPNNPWLINTDRTDLTEAVRDPSLTFAEGGIAAALSNLLAKFAPASPTANASSRDCFAVDSCRFALAALLCQPAPGATTGEPLAMPPALIVDN
jgi:hypothetical protein